MQLEQQRAAERTINSDPREQSPTSTPVLSPRRRKGLPWLWIALVFLIVVGCIQFFSIGSFSSSRDVLPARSFVLHGNGKLIVEGTAGSIHIHRGSDDQIRVAATRYAYGMGTDLNGMQLRSDQAGNTVTLHADEGWEAFGNRGIDMDITVPATTDLVVQDVSGSVHVESVNGNFRVNTVSGEVQVQNMSGTLNASTVSGSVELEHDQLQGPASLSTISGSVHFSGSLASGSSYSIDTVSGSIDMALPTNAAFQLSTRTTSGSVHNSFDSDTVGSAPYAIVSLHTVSGSMNITQQ